MIDFPKLKNFFLNSRNFSLHSRNFSLNTRFREKNLPMSVEKWLKNLWTIPWCVMKRTACGFEFLRMVFLFLQSQPFIHSKERRRLPRFVTSKQRIGKKGKERARTCPETSSRSIMTKLSRASRVPNKVTCNHIADTWFLHFIRLSAWR